MNDIAKFSGGSNLPANPEDLVKGLSNVTQTLAGVAGGTPFFSMKNGIYFYGQEKIEIEEGSRWAVNPYSIKHGWACWVDFQLLGEKMVPFNAPLPAPNELQDFGEDWAVQLGFNMMCMNGEDEGLTVLYKSTAKGFRAAAKELIDAIAIQAKADPKHIVPILELDTDSYNHPKHGETFTPVFNIVEWVTMAGPEAAAEESAQETAEETADDVVAEMEGKTEAEPPKKTRARRGKAKAEEKPAEEATGTTTRRRRRRAS